MNKITTIVCLIKNCIIVVSIKDMRSGKSFELLTFAKIKVRILRYIFDRRQTHGLSIYILLIKVIFIDFNCFSTLKRSAYKWVGLYVNIYGNKAYCH